MKSLKINKSHLCCRWQAYYFKMALIAQIISPSLIILFSNYIICQFNSKCDAKNQYPPGSLACKTHHMTEIDCSNRYLVDIPFLDQNSTTALYLDNNKLTEIKGAPFEQLPLLWRLNISHNGIAHLSSTAFRGIWSLVYLDLMYNQLEVLPSDLFFNLTKLESINLLYNVLTVIPNEALELEALRHVILSTVGNVSKLSKLEFHKSNLNYLYFQVTLTSNIWNDTFQNFSHLPLQQFYMYPYPLNYPGYKCVVEKGAFAPLSNIVEMGTYTETLAALGSLNAPLQYLDLITIEQSLTCVNNITLQVLWKFNSTLSQLTIQYQSNLQRIEDDSFIWTPNLVTLNLNNNEINYLAQYAFNGLIALQELNLASNDLKVVPSDALGVFRKSASLQYLDLRSNSISFNIANDAFSVISASLSMLKLSAKLYLPSQSIKWITKLQKLNHLYLESIGPATFQKLSTVSTLLNLQKLDINSFMIYFSPCFCYPNLESLTMDNNFMRNFPADLALHKCTNLRVLSMSCFQSDTNSLDEKHLNITFPFMHTLKIIQNKMTSVKLILSIKAPKLKILDISSNSIKVIDIEIGQKFPNLTHLNISDNAVVSLSGLENCKLLEHLNAAVNQITVVSAGIFSSLITLDLRKNPFTCSCDILPFKKWIISDNATWLIPGEYVCASPEALKGISITAIDLDCRSHTAFYLAVSIPLALVLCIGIILLIHYQWHIKYKLFLLYRNYYPFPDNNEDFEMLQLQYHAYRRVYHIVAYLQVGVYHIVAYHDRNFIRKWTSGICRVRKLYRI